MRQLRAGKPDIGQTDSKRRERLNLLFGEALLAELPPCYLADADGRIIQSSPAFDALHPGTIAGSARHAARATPSSLNGIFKRIRSTGDVVRLTDNVDRDGDAQSLLSTHFPIRDDKGVVVGFGGVYKDLTDVAQAKSQAVDLQQRYEDFLRATSDWIWETNPTMRLTSVSARIATVLEEPTARLIGRSLFDLGAFPEPPDEQRSVREQIEMHMPFRDQLLVVETRSGENRRIHLSGIPVFDDRSGTFLGYRGTGTDVTRQFAAESFAQWARGELEKVLAELRTRNTELDMALEKARSADEAKSHFLALVSHELRTPLNAIIGFSELAIGLAEGVGKRQESYLKEIHAAGNQLLGVVSDLLDLTSIENEKLNVEITETPLRPLISEAWMQVSLRAEQRGLKLVRFEVEDALRVSVDPDRARQIFLSLLGNAVKFANEAGQIGIDALDHDAEQIAVAIWNTGHAIPAEERPKVFESFHRGNNDVYQSTGGGMGIGLTLARRLARLMQGEVQLDQQDEDGTRFVVRLPKAV